ncbi:putative methyltransferase-like protein [Botrytis fragariae]|uniref:Putative methyltransferase-like protein n=1 Tax=Botrytis fragariae TaxID=1964551 RepID=A0A8H6B3G2_9HELO|nr:putative methyltransferase-like protein [Botrytis fragariae]KAF5878756.1 putative methyltransferase-like protein [Botrytis fragariae]
MSSTPSTSQYDAIGSRYAAIKNQQGSSFELAAIQTHIGNITGLRILDLACGAGYYTQKLLEWGAERVVGIDISPAMIESARVQCGGGDLGTDNEHLKYHFHVADCSKPLENLEEKFHLVLAVWFLNYASEKRELLAMWRNIFASLVPGGRCVGIVPNFESLRSKNVGESRHGVTRNILCRVDGGAKVQISVHGKDGEKENPLVFEAYIWERELYEDCAREAGMEGLKWLEFVDPLVEGLDFEEFLEMPHFKCFVASRSGE